MEFIILSLQVDVALLNQVFGTIKLALFYCQENRCLALIVDIVWIASLLSQKFANFYISFSSCIKHRRLPIAVDMISFAAMFNQQFD